MYDQINRIREVAPRVAESLATAAEKVREVEGRLREIGVHASCEAMVSSKRIRKYEDPDFDPCDPFDADRDAEYEEIDRDVYLGWGPSHLSPAINSIVVIHRDVVVTREPEHHCGVVERYRTIFEMASCWASCDEATRLASFQGLPGLLDKLAEQLESEVSCASEASQKVDETLATIAG